MWIPDVECAHVKSESFDSLLLSLLRLRVRCAGFAKICSSLQSETKSVSYAHVKKNFLLASFRFEFFRF
jgi:hypothetical protein